MKLSEFDKIECLCIDHRRNEWKHIDKQFNERGAKVNRFIVGKGNILPKEMYNQIDPIGISKQKDWYGFTENAYCCYLSHRSIIKKAKYDNIKNILMLEDDCCLLDNFDEILEKADKQIKELNLKWDMLYFGSNHTWAKTESVSENILKLHGGTYCWHCVAINQEYHDMFQHLLDLPPIGAFDWLTSVYTQKNTEFNCYAIWPTIAIQKPGMSHVLGSMQDYTKWFKNKGEQ